MGTLTGNSGQPNHDAKDLQCARRLHGPILTADEYSATVGSLIAGLGNEAQESRMAELTSVIGNLMQCRCNPPPVLSWTFIAAEKSTSLDMTKTDPLKNAKEILNFAKRMFESVRCLTTTTCSGRTALASMAPVMSLFDDVALLLHSCVGPVDGKRGAWSGSFKQLSKALRELKGALMVFLGYISVCRCKDLDEFRRLPSISLPAASASISEKCPEYLYPKFPLTSKSMRKVLTRSPFDVAVLAEVVVLQGIFLQLAVEFVGRRLTSKGQGTMLSEGASSVFIENLKNLAVHSVLAAGTSAPELLLDTLREKALPALDLLDENEEAVMRMVLFETAVVDRPLFSAYAKASVESTSESISLDYECVLYMKKLFTARKALTFYRSQKMQSKSGSLRKQMTSWDVPPILFRWLKALDDERIPLYALQDNQALTKWLVSTTNKSTFKDLFRIALASAGRDCDAALEKTDVDESIPTKDDAETLFFVDTAGNEETGMASPKSQAEAEADVEFTAAAKSIKGVSSSKKRKKSNILFGRQGSALLDDTRKLKANLQAQNEDDDAKSSDSDGEGDLTAIRVPEVELSPSSESDEPNGQTERKRRKGAESTNVLDQRAVEAETAGEGQATKQIDRLGGGEEVSVLTPSQKDLIVSKCVPEEKISLLTARKLLKSAKKRKPVMENGDLPLFAPENVEQETGKQVGLIGMGVDAERDPGEADTTGVIHVEKTSKTRKLMVPQKEVSVSAFPSAEEAVLLTDKEVSKQADAAVVDIALEGADAIDTGTATDGHASKELSDTVALRKNASVLNSSAEETTLVTGKALAESAKTKQRATNCEIEDLPAAVSGFVEAPLLLSQPDAEEVDGGQERLVTNLDTRVVVNTGTSNLLPVVTTIKVDPSGAQDSAREGRLDIGEKSAPSPKKKSRDLDSEIRDKTVVALEAAAAKAPTDQLEARPSPRGFLGSFSELILKAGAGGSVRRRREKFISVGRDVSVSEGSRESKSPLSTQMSSKSAKKKKHAMDSEWQAQAAVAPEVAREGGSTMQGDANFVDAANHGQVENSGDVTATGAEPIAENDASLVHDGVAKEKETTRRSSQSPGQPMETEETADGHIEAVLVAPALAAVDSDAIQNGIHETGPGSTLGKKKRLKTIQDRDDEHQIRESIMNEVVDMSANKSGADLIAALQSCVNGQDDAENLQRSRKKIKSRDPRSKEDEQKDTASKKVMAFPAGAQKVESTTLSPIGDETDVEGTSASNVQAAGVDDPAQVIGVSQASLYAPPKDVQSAHGEAAPVTVTADMVKSTEGGASALVQGTEERIEDLKKQVRILPPKVVPKKLQEQNRGQDDNGRGQAKAEVLDLLSGTPNRPSRKGRLKDDNSMLSDSDTSMLTPSGKLSPRRTRSGRELGTPQTPVSRRKPRKKLELQAPLQEEKSS